MTREKWYRKRLLQLWKCAMISNLLLRALTKLKQFNYEGYWCFHFHLWGNSTIPGLFTQLCCSKSHISNSVFFLSFFLGTSYLFIVVDFFSLNYSLKANEKPIEINPFIILLHPFTYIIRFLNLCPDLWNRFWLWNCSRLKCMRKILYLLIVKVKTTFQVHVQVFIFTDERLTKWSK